MFVIIVVIIIILSIIIVILTSLNPQLDFRRQDGREEAKRGPLRALRRDGGLHRGVTIIIIIISSINIYY